VVPRTANTPGLTEALEHAGISPVRVAVDRIEIGGMPFAINERKVVRESDARLLAHMHEGDGEPRRSSSLTGSQQRQEKN